MARQIGAARVVGISRYPDRIRDADLIGTDEPGGWVSQVYRSRTAELKRFLTRRVGDGALAEDLAQEAFLQLHRLERAKVRDPHALLFVIASNLATKHLQRGKPEGIENTEEAEAVTDPALGPETLAQIDEAMRVLDEIVRAMPDRLRAVWTRRQLDDLSPPQIAERLGLSLKAVTRRLERGNVYCRQRLLKRGIMTGRVDE